MAKKDATPLRKAVDYLVDKGKVKNDVDVAFQLGKMSKGTLSTYLNGTAKPSANFIEKFQNKFGINVQTFAAAAPAQEETFDKESLLIKLNKEYEERIAELKIRFSNMERLMISLERLTLNQSIIEARLELAVDLLVDVHPTLKKIQDPLLVAHELDKRFAPMMEKVVKRGSGSPAKDIENRTY